MKIFLLLFVFISSITWSFGQTLQIDTQTDCNCFGGNDGAVTVSTTGGTAPYTYAWDSGLPANSNQTGLVAGTYNVTVTDNVSSTNTLAITITQPTQITASIEISNVSCFASCDGNLSVSGESGGAGGYTYQWDAATGNQNTQTAINLCAGSYTVTITDASGCYISLSEVVNQPSALSASILDSTMISCNGLIDGEAIATATGGTPAYTYQWDANAMNQTSDTATGLSANTYVVTVTDNNGCQITTSVVITEPSLITVDAGAGQNVCANNSDVSLSGSVTVASGGVWTGGAGAFIPDANSLNVTYTPSAAEIANGSVTLTLTSTGNGTCTQESDNITITITDAPTVDAGADLSVCANTANVALNGTVTVASGGQWSGGSGVFTPNNTDLTAVYTPTLAEITNGSVTLTLTSTGNGTCTADSDNVTITINENPTVIIQDAINPSFFGASDGRVQVNVTGGTLPYVYSWSNSETTDSIYNLSAGTYVVTVIDASGCQDTISANLIDPAGLNTETDIITYSFPEQTSAATIDAVTYTVDIEVVNGTDLTVLTADFSLSAGASATIGATTQNTSVTANDFSSGALTYSITAEDGTTIQDWIITVTEAASGLSPETDIITYSFPEQTGTSNIVNDTVFIEVANGTGLTNLVAHFSLSPGATVTVASITQDSAVTVNDFTSDVIYTVTAEDAVTTKDWIVMVTEAASGLSTETDIITYIFAEQTSAATIDAVSHTVNIEVVNGTDLTDLTAEFFLSAGANATVSATAQDSAVTANDFTNPVIYTITAEDGTTIQDWIITVTLAASSLSTEADFLTYSFPEQTGTSNIVNDTVFIEVANGTDLTNLIAHFSLSVGANATVSATAQDSAVTANDFTNPVTYTITAEDGTTQDWIITVTEAASGLSTETDIITYSFPEQTETSNIVNDTVFIEVANGTDLTNLVAHFSLSVGASAIVGAIEQDSAVTANDFTSYLTYTVTAEDAATTKDWIITVTEAGGVLTASIPAASVCGSSCTVDVTVSVNGGFTPYTYLWTDGQTTETALNLCGGSPYTVTVTDNNSNTTTATVSIVALALPTASISNVASCIGATNGQATVNVTGGTGTYSYLWDDLNGSTTSAITNLNVDSTYAVTVTDVNDCSATASVTVVQSPSEISITSNIITDLSCPGADNGSIDVNVTGGAVPYTFLWSNGATTEDVDALTVNETETTTEYSLEVTDDNGCSTNFLASVSVTELPNLNIEITNSTCGNIDGTATLSEITEAHTTIWSTGETTDNISNLSPGTYSVLVTFAAGCSKSEFFQIADGNISVSNSITEVSCQNCNDGSISLTVSGGTSPYTINWSNGIEGLTNSDLFTGSYAADISDANNCQTNICVQVNAVQELEVNITGTDATACGTANGTAVAVVNGGTSPYNYNWTGGSTAGSIAGLPAGIYYCTVSDALGNSVVSNIAIGDNNDFEINISDIQASNCNINNGLINVYTSVSGTYTYLWSNGSTVEDIVDVSAGSYSLLISDGACKIAFNTEVLEEQPLVQQICMVTVDTMTNHNLIVWEKEQEEGLDYFNIYKQNCNGDYTKIGLVDADAITVFEDITSQPSVMSYGYKISSVNNCGIESVLSTKHKTMHLRLNMNEEETEGQLIWDDYEGFPNPVFKLFVKLEDEMDWQFVRDIPNDQYYTNVGFTGDTLVYAINVAKPDGEFCDAWNGNGSKASGGPYYQSSSNIEDEGTTNTGNNVIVDGNISIYPVPSYGVLNIDNSEMIKSIKIFDTTGKLINSYYNINSYSVKLNTQNINRGIYFMEIQSNETYIRKLIIE